MPNEDPPSIATAAPHLIEQWHPRGNRDRTPYDTAANSHQVAYWVCAVGHPWDETPENRIRYATGCPVCASKRIRPGINDLVTLEPTMAAEWDAEANQGVDPKHVAPGAKAIFGWAPVCGHRFDRSPAHRRQDPRCPVCLGKRLYVGENDVASQRPDLVLLLESEIDPATVTVSSRKSLLWRRECGHPFRMAVADMAVGTEPRPCHHCQRPSLRGSSPVVADDSGLMDLWDRSENTLDPTAVYISDNRTPIAWQCSQGHTWTRPPRRQKAECGTCIGREVVLISGVNDLATVNPALAAQWHPARNGDLQPVAVRPKSNVKVWWLGPCGCEWEAKVANRSLGSGCSARHSESRVLP